jgi:acyl carrier protein
MNRMSRISQFVHEEFLADAGVPELSDDFDLLEGGLLDSLRLLKVIGWLEQELGVLLPEDSLVPANFRSINAICALVAAGEKVVENARANS